MSFDGSVAHFALVLDYTPLSGYTIVYLSFTYQRISQLLSDLVVMNKAVLNIHVQVFVYT